MVGITVLLVLTTIAVTFLAVTPVTVVAQPVEVRVTPETPESGYIEEGATFTVTIDIKDVTDLNYAQFDLSFDPDVVKVSDVKKGEIEGVDVSIIPIFPDADTVRVIANMPMGEGVSGSGYLAKIEFVAKGDEGDESVLDISEGELKDKEGSKRLFSISANGFKDELNDEEISDELKAIFEDKGYPLENPTVEVIKDSFWEIIDFPTRVYGVSVQDNIILNIKDKGKILANWIDAEIRIGEDEEEEEEEEEDEVDEEVTPGSPNITAWEPAEAVVSNAAGEPRTFNISVNQIADISWQINGTEVQTNETVTEASFTKSAVIGTWNVSAIATNTTTGLSDMHTWIWNVTLTLTATVTPTPTPTLAPRVTSAPEAEAEGTPTSQEKEPVTKEKATSVPTAAPTPKQEVPGFEAVFAIAVMLGIGIVYILQRRR